ncbi:MAG: glycosyltransferase family 2 protein [Azospirillaceae bacterium]
MADVSIEDPIDVTVVIAAWQAEASLEAAVASALDQTGVTVEVVVVDDASMDGTGALAEALAARHPTIRAIRLARNGGAAVARNAALAEARGRWVAVLDADDRFLPGRLSRLVARGEADGLDVVLDDIRVADTDPGGAAVEAGEPLVGHRWRRFGGPWRLGAYARANRPYAARTNLGFLKPVILRAFLARHGLAYDPALRSSQDYMLMVRLLIAGARVGYEPAAGYLYIVRSGSLSGRVRPSAQRALMRAEARLIAEAGPGLAAADRAGLAAHYRSLVAARRTFHVFEALRRRRPGRALGVLVGAPALAPVILVRVGESGLRRLLGLGRGRAR